MSAHRTLHSNERKLNGLFSEDWTALLKSAQFASKGKCFTGYVTTHKDLERVFETFKRVSGTSYSTRAPCFTETFDGIAQEKFLNSLTRPRLFWKLKVGEPNIPYDKVPFMMYGQMAEFLCIYGPKTRKYASNVKKENMIISLPDSIDCENAWECKVPCSAHITIRRILRFPDHKLAGDIFPGVSAMRKAKKDALDALEDAICRGTAKTEDRYYISLPTPLAHSSHEYLESYMTLGSTATLNSALNDHLCKLLNRGIMPIDQIQAELCQFVKNGIAPNQELSKEDRSFYPHKNDIAKHIYLLYESGKVTSKIFNGELKDTMKEGIAPIPGSEVIDSAPVTNNKSDLKIEKTNSCTEFLLQKNHEDQVDTSTKKEFARHSFSSYHQNFSTDGSCNMELSKDSPRIKPNLESMKEASIASEEVRNLLRLIENQTYLCKDAACLNSLSEQLTSIANKFSGQSQQIPTPSLKQSVPAAPRQPRTPKRM